MVALARIPDWDGFLRWPGDPLSQCFNGARMLTVSTLRGKQVSALLWVRRERRQGEGIPGGILIPTCGLWGAGDCRDLDGRCGGGRSDRAPPCGLRGHRDFVGRVFAGPAGTWQDMEKARKDGVGASWGSLHLL